MSVTTSAVNAAFDRVDRFLQAAPVLEVLFARRLAERSEPDDVETAEILAAELFASRAEDGSWEGSLIRTAESLLLLGQLLPDQKREERCNTSVAWLLHQKDQPGRFAERCTPDRHKLSICAHFMEGFFSPGPRHVSFEYLTLSNRLVIPDDEDARLAASALALRAVARWSDLPSGLASQLRAMDNLATMSFRPVYKPVIGAGAFTVVLSALVEIEQTPERRELLQAAFNRLAALQRGDGSWPDLEAVHAAELLLLALTNGYSSPVLESALQRSAALLVVTQHENGSWSNVLDPQRTYIGWRLVRHAALSEKANTPR